MFREGRLPSSEKHAIVTLLLNKTGMDGEDQENYRSVSNLTFMSKLVERVVASRLSSYVNVSLMLQLQSAYRRHHSTETSLLRVTTAEVYQAVTND